MLDKNTALGGAWGTTRGVEVDCDIEMACHIVEYWPGAYDLIQKLSGVPFTLPSHPPIKVGSNQRVRPYMTRRRIFHESIAEALELLQNPMFLRSLMGRNVSTPVAPGGKTLLTNWSLLWRRIITLPRFRGIQGPLTGYANFIEEMVRQSKKLGIDFVTEEVADIVERSSCAEVQTRSRIHRAERVLVSASTHLPARRATENIAGTRNQRGREYQHYLVALPRAAVSVPIPPYIHFYQSEHIHRVSTADHYQNDLEHFFIVETRNQGNQEVQNFEKLIEALIKCGSIKSRCDFRIASEWTTWHDSSSGHMDPSLDGLTSRRVAVLPSKGNLARSLALLQTQGFFNSL